MVNGQNLEFAISAEEFDLASLLDVGTAYYIEVETGSLDDHRFDVTGGGEGFLTLANDSDIFTFAAPHNTMTGAAPTALQGSRIALHRHKTIDTVFPTSDFNATTSSATSDRVQFNIGGQWFNYWLFDDQGSARWVTTANMDLEDMGGLVVPPGRGMFLDNRGNQIASVMAFGEVRPHGFVNPLAQGRNLTAGGYPVNQSATGPNSRELTRANGLFGSRDFKTADTIFRWRPDISSSFSGYDTYFLLYRPNPVTERFVRQNDASLTPRQSEMIFDRDRSIFIRLKDPLPAYRIPAPWSANPPQP